MYRFSRSIYRELSPRVIEEVRDPSGCRNKQAVLDACEGVVRRLASDRRYFARPARTLFTEIRTHFAMTDQLAVWRVVERNITLAVLHLEQMPDDADLGGVPRHCQAHTRRGTPCQRDPLPGRDYCPSHKHLEESFDGPEIEFETIEAMHNGSFPIRAAA